MISGENTFVNRLTDDRKTDHKAGVFDDLSAPMFRAFRELHRPDDLIDRVCPVQRQKFCLDVRQNRHG